MNLKSALIGGLALALVLAPACKKPPAKKKGPTGRVFFVAPKDGAKVKSPLKVVMGVEGMKVKPAGTMESGTGHHHIIINGKGLPQGTVVPADANNLHFGKGQTETELKLKPGKHTLTLQFADGKHASYGPALSKSITVTVE